VLIFGDSMAQNYIPAILELDGIRNAGVDIVSRGGCVLAENAILVNYGSPDTDCLRLRDHLYGLKDRYDLVVWSQNWLDYGNSLNWETPGGGRTRAFGGSADFSGWRGGIDKTIEHFALLGKKIVVIGPPVTVDVNPIVSRIGPVTNISGIAAQLDSMHERSTENRASIDEGIRALVTGKSNTLYVDPRSIVCVERHCRLSDGTFSYYLDSLHNTSAAIPALRTGLEQAGLQL